MTMIGQEKLDVLDRRDVYDFFKYLIDESELHNKSFNARTVIVQKVNQWGDKENEAMMNVCVQFDIMVNGVQHKWVWKKGRAFDHGCSHQIHEPYSEFLKRTDHPVVIADKKLWVK